MKWNTFWHLQKLFLVGVIHTGQKNVIFLSSLDQKISSILVALQVELEGFLCFVVHKDEDTQQTLA